MNQELSKFMIERINDEGISFINRHNLTRAIREKVTQFNWIASEEEKTVIEETIEILRKELDLYKAIELHSTAMGREVSVKELAETF